MTGILGFGLIIFPALTGTTLVLLGRRISLRLAPYIALVVTALATLSALGLTAYIDQDIPFALTWIPGTGTMTLPIGSTGLYAALATTATAFLILLMALAQNDIARSSVIGILLITLSATNVAFLSGHFLGRYVALEVVGACVALTPLLALRDAEGSRRAKFVYLVLRIGDAGFLAAILILMQAAGTLDISDALAAGLTLDAERRAWVIVGFLLAVWVKVGAWPFHGWLHTDRRLDLAARAWTYAIVMPNLGFYLLYRITSLLVSQPALQQWTLWLGAAGTLIAAIIALAQTDFRNTRIAIAAAQGGLALCVAASGLKPVVWLILLMWTLLRLLLTPPRDTANADNTYPSRWTAVPVAVAGVLLILLNLMLTWWLAHDGGVTPALTSLLATAGVLIGYRCVRESVRLWRAAQLAGRRLTQRDGPALFLTTLALAAALVAALGFGPLLHELAHVAHADFPPLPSLVDFIRAALLNPLLWLAVVLIVITQRWRQTDAQLDGDTSPSSRDIERGVLVIARRVNAIVELRFLEQVMDWIPRSIAVSAAFLHRVVEEGGLEGLLRGVVRGTVATSHNLQRWHTGRLRANLGWVAALLLLAVLVVVLQGW